MEIVAAAGVGQGIEAANAGWSFGGKTAESFGVHVRRSIPSYEEGHRLVAALSDFFVRPGSVVYELGTSVGELIERLAHRHGHNRAARWIAVDVEPDMIALARSRLAGLDNVTVDVADVADYNFVKTDLVVSYYCLQFVAPKYRQEIVNRIYRSLNRGGAFIWFEKVLASDARFQDVFTSLYTDFKVEQGFKADEIIAKTRSLKGVLEPFSSQGNRDLLARAGFLHVNLVFRRLCFEGVLAIK